MKNAQRQKLRLILRISLGIDLFCILLLIALIGQKNSGWATMLLGIAVLAILLFTAIVFIVFIISTIFLLKEDYDKKMITRRYVGKLGLEWLQFGFIIFLSRVISMRGHHIIFMQELLMIGLSASFVFLLRKTLQYMRR